MRPILILLAASVIAGQAALTKVAQEPFIGPGTLASTAPGTHFSSISGPFTMVRVGPSTSASPAPGWSADVRVPSGISGSADYRGTIQLSVQTTQSGMWSGWFRIKQLPRSSGIISVMQLFDQTSNVVADFVIDSFGRLTCAPFNYGHTPQTLTGPVIKPNTWVWLAMAWHIQSGANFPYGIRCLSMPLGGSLSTWGSADGLDALATSFTSVNVGLWTGGAGPALRIGCPSLYSISSFTDAAYPSDITAPVEKSYNWYVNPATGNDASDGSTPATAWKTAGKITTESQYCGMIDSNATGPGGGDVLTIDTSTATLPIDSNVLGFATQGLCVQPASGQIYIKFQAENSSPTPPFRPLPEHRRRT